MARYPLLENYESFALDLATNANRCELFEPAMYPSETWERFCEIQREAAFHFRELSRTMATLAALGQQVVDEAEEFGLTPPFNTEADWEE